ncbi:hypothetical protein [Halorubrum vacuolatum]|uniref:Uncharacterized protein n=1 Tax=Halorubrum vacuolatum TaxID=63740 RepID=A0A238YAT5_HALVU|nr:hypothetical protein [Halorubrum vacuolatum]SNR67871.1 hypothetical protein SAMN06264855_1352 [Halorubrum vacuolatum]
MQHKLTAYSLPFRVHVGQPETLWTTATRSRQPTTLIVTPVQLHKRNLETRLREQSRPMSSLLFRRLRGVAEDLLEAANKPAIAADRVDRLASLTEILTDPHRSVYDHLGAVIGEPLTAQIETVERARSELELVTGFHPRRMEWLADTVRSETRTASGLATIETLDLLAGVSQLHADLNNRLAADTAARETPTTRLASETTLLTRAIRELIADPGVWTAAYPTIERFVVAGASMLTAPLEDLLRAVVAQTDTDVHLHLRTASGPPIDEHLRRTKAVEEPGTQAVFAWR